MADRTDSEIAPEPEDCLKAATASGEATSFASEISSPMLDVHARHEAIHTWKDFLIHIATIAIGLLIAIGLEQTVEWMHHRHQLREAREAISIELEQNRRILQMNLEQVGKVRSELDRNMAMLREHRLSHSPVTLNLDYAWRFFRTPDAAWQSVKQNGSLGLMPYEELKTNVYGYTVFGNVMDSAIAFNTAVEVAGAIARCSPDGNLSPRDTDELITATSDAQGKLAFTAKLLSFEGMGLQQGGPAYLRPGYKAQ